MRTFTLLLVVAALAAPAAGLDTVSLEIREKDRVRGTLRPANEREAFVLAALRGSSAKATVRRDDDSELVPAVELVGADSTQLAAGRATSNGAKIARVVLATTEMVAFRVTGDGADGDYRLDVAVTPQRVWKERSVTPLDAGATTDVTFAAPAGSVADIDVRAVGAGLSPAILGVTGPDGERGVDPPSAPGTRHRAQVAVLASGEHAVRFRNDGSASGSWAVTIRLRTPSVSRNETDIRDASLGGTFGGTQAIYGRIASATTGAILDPSASLDVSGTDLEGVTFTVPAGSLAIPTLVTMAAVEPLVVNGTDNAASATIEFAPAGTVFGTGEGSVAATMSLPYDVDSVDSAENDLSIVVESADGTQETIEPTVEGASVTFPVSHFSRFQATSRRPRPIRGTFVEIELAGRSLAGSGAEITCGRNALVVAPKQGVGPTGPATATRVVRRTSIGWGPGPVGGGRLAAAQTQFPSLPATVSSIDEGRVRVAVQAAPVVDLDRGRGNDGLTAVEATPAQTTVRFRALFRRAKGDPSRGNLAGLWHARVFECGGANRPDGTVGVGVTVQDLELAVGPAGGVTVVSSGRRRAEQAFPDTGWFVRRDAIRPKGGSLEPSGGEAVLRLNVGSSPLLAGETTLVPVLRGDILVGGSSVVTATDDVADSAAFRVVLLVRASKADSAEALAAVSLFSSFAMIVDPAAAAPAPVRFETSTGTLTTAGVGAQASIARTVSSAEHDAAGVATFEATSRDEAGVLRVGADGSFGLVGAPARGIVTPRGGGAVVGSSDTGVFELGVALPSKGPLPSK